MWFYPCFISCLNVRSKKYIYLLIKGTWLTHCVFLFTSAFFYMVPQKDNVIWLISAILKKKKKKPPEKWSINHLEPLTAKQNVGSRKILKFHFKVQYYWPKFENLKLPRWFLFFEIMAYNVMQYPCHSRYLLIYMDTWCTVKHG